jgi:hypothetical protein
MQCAADGCTNTIEKPATGRPGKYCSDRCANRARKQAQRERNRLSVTPISMSRKVDIRFYCGLNETTWNHHPMQTGPDICIAPVTTSTEKDKATGQKYKVLRNTHVFVDPTIVKHVLLDSGAFSDGIELQDGKVVGNKRLSFDQALQRQMHHAYRYKYLEQVEAIVSYDLLIDETWQDGERSKIRWSTESAEYAVQETIAAARYLSSQRRRIDAFFGHHVRLVLSAQGVDAEQYARCAEAIVQFMKPDDIFGLGGWCITGLMRHIMLPAAAAILPGVFEVLGRAKVKRLHVFGVIIPKLLGFLLHLCQKYGIELSTDSSGPCSEPAKNGNWGYGSWTKPDYKVAPILESCKVLDEYGNKAPSCSPDTICRGLERCRHVALTSEYLAHFSEHEPDLVAPIIPPKPVECYQLSLLEEAS